MNDCFYCENGEKLQSLMIEICKLEASTVYLNRDQKHKGRVIIALNEHKDEYFQMEEQQRNQYFKEVSLTAQAIQNLYAPDKINYATFGDLVSHVHIHMVPKHKNGFQWGKPFEDIGIPKVFLTDEEYTAIVEEMKKEILNLTST